MRATPITVVAVALAVLAAACGDAADDTTTTTTGAPADQTTTVVEATTTTAPSPPPADDDGVVVIEIRGFAFVPSTFTVTVGATVEWVNRDGTEHTTTAAGEWDELLSQGDTFQYVANTPGEYDYVCTIHMGMAGTLIVEG